MKVRDVIARLHAEGWVGVRVSGSYRQLMRGAVAMHLQGMRESGEEIPQPTSQAVYLAA